MRIVVRNQPHPKPHCGRWSVFRIPKLLLLNVIRNALNWHTIKTFTKIMWLWQNPGYMFSKLWCISQISQNALFVIEMCILVLISATRWCILGYGIVLVWDLCNSCESANNAHRTTDPRWNDIFNGDTRLMIELDQEPVVIDVHNKFDVNYKRTAMARALTVILNAQNRKTPKKIHKDFSWYEPWIYDV